MVHDMPVTDQYHESVLRLRYSSVYRVCVDNLRLNVDRDIRNIL